MSAPRARSMYGEGQVDRLLSELTAAVGRDNNDDLVRRMIVTALDMDAAEVDRLELKIASQSMVEMLNAWRVFSPYRGRAKCTIFGSARTSPDHPDYELARSFGAKIAERDWMIISGAGPGIMTACIEGAGVENSFGVNIVLPFEQRASEIIDRDPKLATFRYFFTRKLFFMKESDGFVLLPGGFGTLDETFELITLIQTGKAYPAPIVMLDHPGSNYWSSLLRFVEEGLLANGMIGDVDTSLVFHTHDPEAAADYIADYYSCFHSMRYVGRRLVIRTNTPVSSEALARLNDEFGDIIVDGAIEPIEVTNAEVETDDHVTLPRIALEFNDRSFARLNQLIMRINELAESKARVTTGMFHDLEPENADMLSD
ncbi:MAG: LOG family protein [Acidimicrobiales bacterium]